MDERLDFGNLKLTHFNIQRRSFIFCRVLCFPFKKEAIPFSEIAKCDARQYSPIKEYGGWGIRYGTKGMAYNVSGDRGVQLELTNGKRLLIGSQRSEELAKTIISKAFTQEEEK